MSGKFTKSLLKGIEMPGHIMSEKIVYLELCPLARPVLCTLSSKFNMSIVMKLPLPTLNKNLSAAAETRTLCQMLCEIPLSAVQPLDNC